jgi:RTX calcium-binding nonapeptide repeat (4 copies)
MPGTVENDWMRGWAGNDTIYVSQRARDNRLGPGTSKEIVDCGSGTDTVTFDKGVDVVKANCERKYPYKMP